MDSGNLLLQFHRLRRFGCSKFQYTMKKSDISITLTVLLALSSLIGQTLASGSSRIGDPCKATKDCDQQQFLICKKIRETCDCPPNTVFSSHQKACVAYVGQVCIMESGSGLPNLGCVDHAKCNRERNSVRPIGQGKCDCEMGFYRTQDNFCHEISTIPTSNNPSSTDNKYPSLSNVLNSVGGSQSSSSGSGKSGFVDEKDPPPYSNSLTRSGGVARLSSNQCTLIFNLALTFMIVLVRLSNSGLSCVS